MSLCVPRSPFQRERLPLTGDRCRESTLHAESLSRSSYEESSSSSSSSSRRDAGPSSGKAVKSDWLEVSKAGASRLDWLPSVDEKPRQLKLWKVWSFCTKKSKKGNVGLYIWTSDTIRLKRPFLLEDYCTGRLRYLPEELFFVYLHHRSQEWFNYESIFHTLGNVFIFFRVWRATTGISNNVI